MADPVRCAAAGRWTRVTAAVGSALSDHVRRDQLRAFHRELQLIPPSTTAAKLSALCRHAETAVVLHTESRDGIYGGGIAFEHGLVGAAPGAG